ncbi:filament-like plant protein 7 isoform X2 [Rutidosis leptorrhynchoides]|uniref:filament-like plant protein 7 isoform X2 n=1 Tax=Rutidosis leptorrhynchoides TaxID=125765 RepID=UPI003A98E118
MDHKSWIWKKKSIEKTMIAADKANRGNEDEGVLTYEAELERNLNVSNEKLASALSEINAKDDVAKKQTNIAREAIQGWEKAEAEVLSLKQELDKRTQQTIASKERLYVVDAALKECMQQLRFVREEHEKRIHDAVMKTSQEYEKTIILLEEKLSDSNKTLSKITSENNQLNKALLVKENTIDELRSVRSRLDSDLRAVMSRLESIERDNGSLSYEVRVLEKELEIRNEERDFNRRTADVSHKRHLERVKKIAKLETEVQRLRLLVKKRLPGPADLAKMKSEVEMLGRDPTEASRRSSNPFPVASKDTLGKQVDFLTEQLCLLEEENRVLKEFINRKTNEKSKSQTPRNLISCHDFTMSDIGSDEKASMAESWAPSCKTVGTSDIDLMDDFVEMEKLAIVSVKKPFTAVSDNHSDWVENILKAISEHSRVTQRRSRDIVEDITVALTQNGNQNPRVSTDTIDANSYEMNNETLNSDMIGSIQKLIQLIEGIRLCFKDDNDNSSTGYTVRVLQWKTSELGAVLDAFLRSCTNLVNKKADLENFTKELTLTFEWIVNHCFSLQDVSSMRCEMEKNFDWDEGKKLTDDLDSMESIKLDLERKLQLEVSRSESLISRLEESEKTLDGLRTEVESLKHEKHMFEDKMEVGMKVKEDLDEQLIEAIGEYSEAHIISSLEEQRSNNSSFGREMEARDLNETVLQESVTERDIQECKVEDEEKRLQNDHEIIAASEKLAKCQETILNLGKQFKALASPNNTHVPFITTSSPARVSPTSPVPDKTKQPRISLLDKMMAEDAARDLQTTKTNEVTCTMMSPGDIMDGNDHNVKSPVTFLSINGIKHQEDEDALVNFLSIVPAKKKKGGMLGKLLWRKKKSTSK